MNWQSEMKLLPSEPYSRGQYWERLTLPNGWQLSLQASDRHYCSPQDTNPDPTHYEAWELAVFFPNGDWVNPDKHMPELRELLPHYEQLDSPVCGYVTVAEVDAVIRLIKNK